MQVLSFSEHKSVDFKYVYENLTDYSADFSTHTHNGWEFLLVINGKLSYTVDGNVFDIGPGILIIARPGEIHSLISDGPIHYERYSVVATEQLFPKELIAQFPSDIHVLDLSKNRHIPALYEKFRFYIDNLKGEHQDRMLRQLIGELMTDIYIAAQTPSKSVASQSNITITKVVSYIKEHIREPLTVQTICDHLFISPSYLHYCFAKHLNVTPRRYIMLQKLQLAQQALVNAENPTKVCREFGFHNYSTFYRNYQKIYGCRPSETPQKTLLKIDL